jgi:SnoaL-like domain
MTDATLLARIDRIESQLAIGQLPPRYALALDSRDLDSLVGLFAPDVDCGRWGIGRQALKDFYDPTLRQFYRCHHQIVGHVIELDPTNPDRAKGSTYCRAEHEDKDKWIVMTICYFDLYERHDGHWYFKSRDERHWYSSEICDRPGQPQFQNWDKFSKDRYQPRLPNTFPHWEAYWSKSTSEQIAELTCNP